MCRVVRGDDDGVDVRACDDVGPGCGGHSLRRRLRGLPGAIKIDVGDHDYAGAVHRALDRAHVIRSHDAGANHANAHCHVTSAHAPSFADRLTASMTAAAWTA